MPAEAPFQKPTLGRLPEWCNGYVATHFGGLGINMSPAAGELMAELIATGKPPLRAARTLDHLKLGVAGQRSWPCAWRPEAARELEGEKLP